MLRGLVSLAVVALCWASEADAAEAPKRVSLRWNAPDACPDDAELVRAVESFLGQPLAESREQRLSVSVTVQGEGGGFSAKLSFQSPEGSQERFLEHPECSKLAEGVALLAALAIDPERVKARQAAAEAPGDTAPAPAAPTPPKAEPRTSPPAPACPKPPKAAPPESPYQGALSAALFVGAGTLPGATPGFATEAGLRVRRFRATLVGRYWLSSSANVAGSAPRSIELSLATVGVRACVLPLVLGPWSGLACAGVDMGDMAGSGQGVDDAFTRHALFSAAEGSVALAYTRSRLAPFASLGASLGIARPRFGVARNGISREDFQPSQVGVLASLGLSYGL